MEIAATVLAVCVMLVISANYQNFGDDYACGGGLGLGLPVSFLCDYGAGGSPIDNWGRVDPSDFPYFSLRGLSVDILFYAAPSAMTGVHTRRLGGLNLLHCSFFVLRWQLGLIKSPYRNSESQRHLCLCPP